MITGRRNRLALLGLALLAGCANTNENAALKKEIDGALASLAERAGASGEAAGMRFQVSSFDALEGWGEDDFAPALKAFRMSCQRLADADAGMALGGLAGRAEDWRPACQAARTVRPENARAFFETAFTPVRMAPGERALITAYYEPELDARRRPDSVFRYPLYRKPAEVVFRDGEYGVADGDGVKPFLSRGEIDRGGLEGRGLEIAWLDDPVDVFFLHVQGSGRLRFEDGSVQRVAFAAKNGYDYSSAGMAMVRAGALKRSEATADGIKDYVRRNPQRGQQFLAANRSYIFFREIDDLTDDGGPEGALGVQLVDGRSIAVDRRYTPLGAPVWLEADDSPVGPIRRLVVAQDTGSAIKGAQRADLFWGTGAEAGSTAGRMKHKGALTVLLPTEVVRRLTDSGS